MKNLFKVLSNTLTIALFLLLILMTFIVITSKASGGEPQIFGNQLKSVLSGSMEPTFKTGSIIAVKPIEDTTTLKVNDVITYIEENGSFVTHRIIDVIDNGENLMFQTKGDNNEDPDTQLVLAQNVKAKYTGFSIPYLGYFIDFAKSSKGTALLLIIPGILLLGYSGISIYQGIREIERNTKSRENEKTA